MAEAPDTNLSGEEIAKLLQDRIGELADHLLGKRNEALSSQNQLRYGNKGSVAVDVAGEKAGTWFDHETGCGGNALVLIKHVKKGSAREAFTWGCKWLGVSVPEPPSKKLPKDPVAKIAVIVSETQKTIEGTPVKLYLQRRGITATPPDCIGYRPKAFGKYGALVALAQDIKGSVLALQQVYLTEDGQKAPLEVKKRTNKTVDKWSSRAVVRFPGKEPVILAEGIETALSLWQATGQETWACLGISNIAYAPLPEKSTVIIARDGDEPNSKADQQITRVIAKMRARGHKVGVATPPEGKDFNDVLVENGEDAIRAAITAADYQETKQEITVYVPSGDPRPVEYADESLALRFSVLHRQDLRYVDVWGKWLHWISTCWEIDETLEVIDCCRAVARAASAEIMSAPEPNIRLASIVASRKAVLAIEGLARADRRHASRTQDWDANTWIINTPDGTVDLTTGQLREHRREDYCTKMAAVSPGGNCPLWFSFLDRAFAGDTDLIAFSRRMVGYSLTGETRDHALFFIYGPGANGKGVFLNTWYRIVGNYAVIAPMETFVATQNDRHPTDLAMMRGARVVISQETEEGHRWAESKIKQMTGGDPIPARFMRQDFFTYQPQFKLMIAGNHKPSLRTVDEAVRRRFHMIPFTVTIPEHERDTQLQEKLKAEWPGILQWAIEGCLEWQRNGLQPPDAVRVATESYLADEDAIQKFLDEKCRVTSFEEYEEVNHLFTAWREWCAVTGEYAGTVKRFSQNLETRRFMKMQHPKTRRACFGGVRLLQSASEPPPFYLDER